MEDQQQNPEKIPLNPIQQPTTDKNLYQSPQATSDSTRNPVMNGMFKPSKQEPAIPFKYKLLLAGIMLLFVIVAVIVGKVLFRNGLV